LAETSVERPQQVTRMAFTKDGSALVLMTQFASIYIRDAGTLKPVGVPIRPEGFTASSLSHGPPHFALTADGRSLVTASETGELTWWDLQSQRKTRTLEVAAGYHALALSPGGRSAVVGLDGGIQLVDVRTGDVRTARAGFTGSPNWLLFSPEGETVVSANEDGTVTLWDVGSATPTETLRGHSIDVQQPVFSSDGNTLYTVSVDGTAIAWDVTGNRSVKRPFTFSHERDLDGAEGRFSPDGRLIAIGLEGKGIALWDVRDLTASGAPLLETGGEVKALAFSPDGRTLAAVARGRPVVLTVWDRASRSQRHELTSADGIEFDFSPDGTRLATTSRPGVGVALWDVATGEALGTIGEFSFATDVAFGANGALVAVLSPAGPVPRAEVWDVATGSRVASVQGGAASDASSVALSPDGGLLAVGLGIHGLVRLWDVRTGNAVHTLDGGAEIGALEFSSDGGILAVAAGTSVSLWDVATGIRIGPSLTGKSFPTMLDLSSDGRRLLTTNPDGTGAVWDVDPKSWARRACALANRTLTREEWERFLPGRPYEPACAT
jgi:WD40 repeat protein